MGLLLSSGFKAVIFLSWFLALQLRLYSPEDDRYSEIVPD
jgi:hypothetical protein